jgi:SAM-dependent methyltransferase
VLDVACGRGRHVRWLAAAGHRVTAVDRDASLLSPLSTLANVETIAADLEGAPWPLPGALFDAVLVTNYLWRALFPMLRAAVAPGGLLVYETFV